MTSGALLPSSDNMLCQLLVELVSLWLIPLSGKAESLNLTPFVLVSFRIILDLLGACSALLILCFLNLLLYWNKLLKQWLG